MPRYFRKSRRRIRKSGNSVIHVPSTIGGTIAANGMAVLVLASPSIDAAGSASSNIEAQDKDRTINVGHHMGMVTTDFAIRVTSADGIVEFCIFKAERQATVPVVGTHPVPSVAQALASGLQQVVRLANPGKTYHYSQRSYSIENTVAHKIRVSTAKFRASKWKAGDYLMLLVFNRGSVQVTYDLQARYKEYE